MKQLLFIFYFLFFISIACATNLVGGESTTFDVGQEFDGYEVVGNSTTLEGITFTKDGTSLIIKADLLVSPDTFTIIFFNDDEPVETVYVGGGGGTRIIYKDKNVTQYVDREVVVEKIVKVEDDDEINRLLGIANEAARKENIAKILLVFAVSFIVFIGIIKIKSMSE